MKILFALPLLLCAFSCSGSSPQETEEEKEPVIQKKIVGRIASVSSTGTFVLIQKYGPGSLPEEDIYQSQGEDGRQASLRPSGERVRDFYAADLIRGEVEIGDAVVSFSEPQVDEVEEPNKNISESPEETEDDEDLPSLEE